MGNFNIFKSAFDAGQKGDSSLYDSWLTKFSLSNVKVGSLFKNLQLKEIEQLFVNRHEEVKRLAEITGYHRKNKNLGFIHVIGPNGVGLTSFLQLIFTYLNKLNSNSILYTSASFFSKRDEEDSELFFDEWVETAKNKEICIIDDCHADLDMMKSYNITQMKKELINSKPLIIMGWNGIGWTSFKSILYQQGFEEENNNLILEPFKNSDINKIITTRITYLKEIQNTRPFTEDAIKKVSEISRGLPLLAFYILDLSLKECFYTKYDKIDEKFVEKLMNSVNLINLEETLDELNTTSRLVLIEILRADKSIGITAEQLSSNLHKDRTSILYHISKLQESKIVYSNKVGKWVHFCINKYKRPIIDLYFLRRGRDHYA